MKFEEALELLRSGVNVARGAWSQADGYLTLLPGLNHVWKIITHPGPNAGNHIFSVGELVASDYMKQSEKLYDEAGNPKASEIECGFVAAEPVAEPAAEVVAEAEIEVKAEVEDDAAAA